MDWKRKLTSRKLWVAIVGFVTGVLIFVGKSETEAAQVGALIMSAASVIAYIVGEGLADAAGAGVPEYLIEDGEMDPPEEGGAE